MLMAMACFAWPALLLCAPNDAFALYIRNVVAQPQISRTIIIEEQNLDWPWNPRTDTGFMGSPEGAAYRDLMQQIDDARIPDSGPARWVFEAKEFVSENFTAQRILALVGILNIVHMLSQSVFGGKNSDVNGEGGKSKKDE